MRTTIKEENEAGKGRGSTVECKDENLNKKPVPSYVGKCLKKSTLWEYSKLRALTKLLHPQDVDHIEWTSAWIAFLFKILKISLKRNIVMVPNRTLPLLDELQNQNCLTNLAAECLSSSARSIREFKNLELLVVSHARKDKNELPVGADHC